MAAALSFARNGLQGGGFPLTGTLGKHEVEATVERIAIAMRKKNATIPRVNYTLTKSVSAVYRKGMQRTAGIANAIRH
jgi:hypothetical protein